MWDVKLIFIFKGPSVFSGYAKANQVNLIAAAYADEEKSLYGSGIYLKDGSTLAQSKLGGGNTLLVEEVGRKPTANVIPYGLNSLIPIVNALKT